MTANKTRVRDLSAELGVSNKELLQALRELGVNAKSHMSSISEEEAVQVKAKFKDHAAATEVIRKEIQPGVIVRRRRKSVPKAEPKPVEEEEEILAAPGEEEEGKLPAKEPEPVAEEPAAPAEPEAEEVQAEEAPAPKAPAEPEFPKAKILSPPHAEAEAPEPEPEAAVEPEAEAEPEPKPEPEQTEPVEAEAEAEAVEKEAPAPEGEEVSEDEAPAKKAKRKRKKKKEPVAGPQVRVISKPEPAPTPPPKAPGAPAAPRHLRPAQPAAAADAGKKKRKKDRRVVDFSQQAGEEERRRQNLQLKKKKGAVIKDKTGGKGPSLRRRKGHGGFEAKPQIQQASQPLKAAKRKIKVDEAIRVADMAHQMGVKAQALIKVLLGLGVMTTINQALDLDTATLVAAEFGYEVEKTGFSEADYILPQEADSKENLKGRPPVVTIMGHVDHGKTSLLDAIRKSNVTSGEAGGITQHIGAYHVKTSRGEIVFLDTPGHEAFTAMRARGAQVTDIVILVVAADDGVMDQTREAINHSRAAGVPILVAVNKIDKEGADPDRVKRELAELDLLPEDWGGETIYANVSAKQRTGIDNLLEMVLLQAEVLELKANPDKQARGHIVEAQLDKGRGAIATVLIQEGTLTQGDPFVCGLFSGRVRAMFNDQGKKVKKAGPSIPVEVQGFEGVPQAGDAFSAMEDEKVARRISESRQLKQRERTLAKETKISLETFLSKRVDQGEVQSLNIILKADVQGSLEAVSDALKKLTTDEVKVEIIHGAAGAITESDILLASASDAIIIGFNVRPTVKVKEAAEREKIEIRFYDIIYKLVGEIKDALSGMLKPEIKEVYLGQAEVRDTFSVPKVGVVAGCFVEDGKITRAAGIRLLRDGVVVYTGAVSSLKRFKDDVKEVQKGYECGIGLEKFNDVKVGDFIEAFEEVEEARTL